MSNKQKKIVSVIIPAYNTEKYISQNIESVICQTYKNIEIIIVNDGSTDGTEKIIQEYSKKDKRIIIINQLNRGVSSARNSGFKIAKGEYFCIIDADDIMMPEKIESQLNFLEDNISADFTYSKVLYFFDGLYDIYAHNLATVNGVNVYKKLLKYGNFIYTGTVFFRRNIFDKFGGFDEGLRSAEEFDYWLSLSRRGVNFLHQDKYLTLCRSRKDGLTSDSSTMYTTCITVFEKYINISGNKFSAYIKYPQYFKSKLLLYFLTLKKPKLKNKNVLGGNVSFLSFSYCINNVFVLLRKLKFWMTFKKIRDKKVQEYLRLIESHKNAKMYD